MIEKFREIYIFVAGATPQIVTETIYALAKKNPPIYPDEVYIITTSIGKEWITDSIIRQGILNNLIEEYEMPPIRLDDSSFIVVTDRDGNPLEDIRTNEDNEILGDTITSFIREKATDMNTRLHCSIAGGRKTMSFYMGAALQLFGRPWDRLYHVLVSAEFESNPEFFYKPKKDKIIDCRMPDGTIKKFSTKHSTIELAELPFIKLRNKVSLHGKGFRELIKEGQKEIDIAIFQPELMVSLSERTIYIGDHIVEMIPMQLLIYSIFLIQKKEHCKHTERPYCMECTNCYPSLVDLSNKSVAEEMAKYYGYIYRNQSLKAEEFLNKWKEGLGMDVLRQGISKINRTIKEQIRDETILPYYLIIPIRQYGATRYGIKVEKRKIRIE